MVFGLAGLGGFGVEPTYGFARQRFWLGDNGELPVDQTAKTRRNCAIAKP